MVYYVKPLWYISLALVTLWVVKKQGEVVKMVKNG